MSKISLDRFHLMHEVQLVKENTHVGVSSQWRHVGVSRMLARTLMEMQIKFFHLSIPCQARGKMHPHVVI